MTNVEKLIHAIRINPNLNTKQENSTTEMLGDSGKATVEYQNIKGKTGEMGTPGISILYKQMMF